MDAMTCTSNICPELVDGIRAEADSPETMTPLKLRLTHSPGFRRRSPFESSLTSPFTCFNWRALQLFEAVLVALEVEVVVVELAGTTGTKTTSS